MERSPFRVYSSAYFRVNPWQCLCVFLAYFRGYSSAYFRVFPCSSVAMLMRLLGPISVLILLLISVFFRVNPWQCLCVFLAYFRVYSSAYFREIPC